ncbi:hypothetical protein RHSIM_Rhsim02G0237300 [Rhododendron simsii]|uniref:WRKY19-like zinc finger domain-containing protein n=1 Tax=Rhododendron simsii TaxID=118357 RepID=A0A834HDF4_RHOSS|nr:hypothetical protein RHSIM_Rhsim02G0237300 [Rhododendron simsii]
MGPNLVLDGGDQRCEYFEFFGRCTESTEGQTVGRCAVQNDVGGQRRCSQEGCGHGGGKRCKSEGGCAKGAEGSTPFCKGHGGGKRCSFEGGGVCPKSVHGGTQFCVAHGGGKRCAILECTKSASGRTDFCVCHGGGKRCQSKGCGKSAQGATDFCKAHGGGKRCSWGQRESEFGQGESPCNLFARGKTGLCTSHGALVQDKRKHGGATLGPMVQDPKPSKPEKMKEVVIAEEGMNVDVLLMGPSIFNRKQFRLSPDRLPVGGDGGLSGTPGVPGDRVHGGRSFLAMLTGSSGLGSNGSKSFIGGPSKLGKSYVAPHNFGQGEPPRYLFAREKTGTGLRLSHSYLVQDKWAHGGAILGSMVQDPTTSTMFFYKRCQSEGCGKSAQGSTGFCNAHAGVKRCSWGQRESEFGQGEEPCNSFAWEMTGLCTLHGARSTGCLVQDKLVRGGATLRPMFLDPEPSKPEKMEEVVIAVEAAQQVVAGSDFTSGLQSMSFLGDLGDIRLLAQCSGYISSALVADSPLGVVGGALAGHGVATSAISLSLEEH